MAKASSSVIMADKIHCAHILVKTETEAKNIKGKLDKGEKFGALAKNFSQCSSSKNGGDLGTFTRGKMVKEFEKVGVCAPKRSDFRTCQDTVWVSHNKTSRISNCPSRRQLA